jgi:hypothetical protein
VFSTEVFSSPKVLEKSDLADVSHCYAWDYSVEWSPTWTQCRSKQPHLVESLQEQNVQAAAFINNDPVEIDILDDEDNNERVLTRLWDKFWVVTTVEGDADLRPLQVLRGGE